MTDITRDGNQIIVAVPFSEYFNEASLTMGAEYERELRAWRFDAKDENWVRELIRRTFN